MPEFHLHILSSRNRECYLSWQKNIEDMLKFYPRIFTNIQIWERQRMRISAKEIEVMQRRSPELRKALDIQRWTQKDAPFASFRAPRKLGHGSALALNNEACFRVLGFRTVKVCVLFQATNYTVTSCTIKPILSFFTFIILYPPHWFLHFPRNTLALLPLRALLIFPSTLYTVPSFLLSTHCTTRCPLCFLSKTYPGFQKQQRFPFFWSTKAVRFCTRHLGSKNENLRPWVSKWKISQIRTRGFKFCHWNFMEVS